MRAWLLRYALHPVQDIFAHPDDVVTYESTLGIGYYSHLRVPKVDDAATHRDVIFSKVEPITIAILSYFTDAYSVLLKNVDGVEHNGVYIIM